MNIYDELGCDLLPNALDDPGVGHAPAATRVAVDAALRARAGTSIPDTELDALSHDCS